MPRIRIVNQPITLLASEQTILDAALAADLPYPYGCRAGTCGTCKTRLLQGRVDTEPHAAEALSDAEAAAGLILACRATPRSDVVIECLGEWLEALPPVRHLQARVVALDTVARSVTRLRLEVYGQPLCFLAGQYAELSFGGRPARAYSMANPPDDPTLEFHIRHFEGVASGYVTRHLGIGALVDVHGPYGSAYLREPPRPLVAVAGSTGLAPIRSIILTALARGHQTPMHLFLGVRDEPDLYGVEELSVAGRAACATSGSRPCSRSRSARPVCGPGWCTRRWRRPSPVSPATTSTWPGHPRWSRPPQPRRSRWGPNARRSWPMRSCRRLRQGRRGAAG